ncbi:MAG: DUF3883 domain-containing protein [Sulfurimonas sp.]
MSTMMDSLLTMSSFEGLLALKKYRKSYPNISNNELIKLLKTYSDKNNFDYKNALLLESMTAIEDTSNILLTLRNVIKQLIVNEKPAWGYAVTFGRMEVYNNLTDYPNIRQCFRNAHLFDENPSIEIINWWDNLSQLFRAEEDIKKVQIGRKGEKLSYEYEKKRLQDLSIEKLPKWIALEDNNVGYDIKSFNLGKYGLINKLIEVKTCSTNDITIYLTKHEWKKALEFKTEYYFHIWYLPTKTLQYELSVAEMEQYVLQNKENSEWTSLKISFNKDGGK